MSVKAYIVPFVAHESSTGSLFALAVFQPQCRIVCRLSLRPKLPCVFATRCSPSIKGDLLVRALGL